MRRRVCLSALVLLAAISGVRVGYSQTSNTENVRIVTTGEIRKIDDKNKTFQFKLDQAPSFNRGQQQGGRRGGVGGGRGRRGGIGYPGGNRGPVPTQTAEESKEVKVFTSESTTIKDEKSDLRFSELKKVDRITVTAIHKGRGDDIEALAVKRD
jgi:hypothetical protein